MTITRTEATPPAAMAVYSAFAASAADLANFAASSAAFFAATTALRRCEISDVLMREMRSSAIFLGAILARCGQADLSYPGGCELGPRPIDLHLAGLRGQAQCITGAGDRTAGLQEQHRLFGRGQPGFAGMVGIVQAYTDDFAHLCHRTAQSGLPWHHRPVAPVSRA